MSRMTDRLAKWRGLTAEERRIFLRALVLLPIVALGLRLRGLQVVRAVLVGRKAFIAADVAGEPLARANAVARLVAAAARYGPYRAKCLPVSLTLAWLLQRQGITTNLRLGVRKAVSRLEAHAWLEFQGVPLIDAPEVGDRFAAFDPIPPARNFSRP